MTLDLMQYLSLLISDCIKLIIIFFFFRAYMHIINNGHGHFNIENDLDDHLRMTFDK